MNIENKLAIDAIIFSLCIIFFFPFIGLTFLFIIIQIWEEIVEEVLEEFKFEGYIEWPDYYYSFIRLNQYYFRRNKQNMENCKHKLFIFHFCGWLYSCLYDSSSSVFILPKLDLNTKSSSYGFYNTLTTLNKSTLLAYKIPQVILFDEPISAVPYVYDKTVSSDNSSAKKIYSYKWNDEDKWDKFEHLNQKKIKYFKIQLEKEKEIKRRKEALRREALRREALKQEELLNEELMKEMLRQQQTKV